MASLTGNGDGGFAQALALSVGAEMPWPQDRMIHEVFEQQVTRTPSACAVVYETHTLTYARLNRDANRLARCLRSKGVGPGVRVAIGLDRSVEMIVALLGVLKAGGAYVPLDPAYPIERITYMLEDSAPRLLITQQSLRKRFPSSGLEVLTFSRPRGVEDGALNDDEANTDARAMGLIPSHLAYVIYTSGSTGRPKGVMVSHSNLMSSTVARTHYYGNPGRFLLLSSLGFDSSVAGIFGTLTSGGTLLVVAQSATFDSTLLVDLVCTLGANSLLCVPALYQRLLASSVERIRGSALSRVMVAGEACPPGLILESVRETPDVTLFNEYGPTEATVWATVFNCTEFDSKGSVSIGRPIANTRIHILSSQGQRVPIEEVGELYIGGMGVAQGYCNQPELTAQRFVADPFSLQPGARLFKSGDLGRWRAAGGIEYLGRNDEQVKLRGYRIELGEIEAQLSRHEALCEVCVMVREDTPGDRRLIAYFVTRSTILPTPLELRAHLKAVLPDYMVPSAFVALERLPTNFHGKFDRRALPPPPTSAYASKPYEIPQGQPEETLALLWQELLQIDQVGRQDNFFELGGHSLLIAQMMERLRRQGLSADVRQAFKSGTLAEFARTLEATPTDNFEVPVNKIPSECEKITPEMLTLATLQPREIEWIARNTPGGAANIQDIYPLAPLQEGLLFHYLLGEERGDHYVLQSLLEFSSRADLDKTLEALRHVMDRHDVLRTAIMWEQLPQPMQVVCRRAELSVETLLLEGDRDPLDQMRDRFHRPAPRLDLCKAPLMRVWVAARPRSEQWYALLEMHHIVCDQVTFDTLLAEVSAHGEERVHHLPAPAPYRNHVAQALTHARNPTSESFFTQALSGVDEPTLPFGLTEVRGDGSQIDEAHEEWPCTLSYRVHTQARRLQVSAATLFHAAWSLVVAVTSSRDDVVFGTVLLGRLQDSAGAGQTLGMLINTLPLRINLQDLSASQLVKHTHERLAELLSHEQASLAVVQRCSSLGGTAPLFTALLNYRHPRNKNSADDLPNRAFRVVAKTNRSSYPLSLSVDDSGETFTVNAQTQRGIDPRQVLAYILTSMESLIEALVNAPQAAALSLVVVPDSERQRLMCAFRGNTADFPQQKLLHELVEAQVVRVPRVPAVVCEGDSLTYEQLNAQANQLARLLRALGVGPDQLVGICVERSVAMVVGLLAILKAGGAYVPLDPSYPIERLHYMLHDASPRVLLTQTCLVERLLPTEARVIALDEPWSEIVRELSATDESSKPDLRPHHLAYVIYTSGSTGRPKGVMVEHRNVVNLVYWHLSTFEAVPRQRSSCVASVGFDTATWEIWSALSSGATLFLASSEVARDPEKLLKWWTEQPLDFSYLPTPVAEILFTQSLSHPTLRTLCIGGDQLRHRERGQSFSLVNNYGPTETAVISTSGAIHDEDEVLHIGRPISNTPLYILDRLQRMVPVGVVGELYIGGAGVARGYLNRPELTTERFLQDPFSRDPRARMYKTGDLGCWRGDGTIEYLGRNDNQVKIRGFRVELGEIEGQLLQHPQVRQALVVAREEEPGEKRLVAYVVLQRDLTGPAETLGIDALRAHLKKVLPDYMLPSAWVMLPSLPLTANGKLDRRALPPPDLNAYPSGAYEAPQGEIEETLAAIWQGALRVERVGRGDNFFDCGGHSLSAMQVLARIRTSFAVALPMGVLFECQTLKELAAAVQTRREVERLTGSAEDGTELEELLEEVAALPESTVQEWLRVMEQGERS